MPNKCQPESPNRPSFAQSVKKVPIAPGAMASIYTASITSAKIGSPSQRLVTILSILSLFVSFLSLFFL